MTTPKIAVLARGNVAELDSVCRHLKEDELQNFLSSVLAAKRVFISGVGRSGLSARAIAMRLMHIGISTYVVGEVVTPAIHQNDLLIAVSSSGRGSIVEQVKSALMSNARVACITTRRDSELARLSEAVITFPIRTEIDTSQHAGSLFEQSVLIVGDAVCKAAKESLGVPTESLNKQHANLI